MHRMIESYLIEIAGNCVTFHFRFICLVPFSGDNFILGCHLLSQSPGAWAMLRYWWYLTWPANKHFSFLRWFMECLLSRTFIYRACTSKNNLADKHCYPSSFLSVLDPHGKMGVSPEMTRVIMMCSGSGIASSPSLNPESAFWIRSGWPGPDSVNISIIYLARQSLRRKGGHKTDTAEIKKIVLFEHGH